MRGDGDRVPSDVIDACRQRLQHNVYRPPADGRSGGFPILTGGIGYFAAAEGRLQRLGKRQRNFLGRARQGVPGTGARMLQKGVGGGGRCQARNHQEGHDQRTNFHDRPPKIGLPSELGKMSSI